MEVTMTIVKAKAAPKRTSTRSSKTRLKIGLYDGTFSPIHYGHLICAERTRQVKGLDLVLFLTCGNPPNKSGVLDAETRHEMVVATVSDNPHFEASRISINQRGIGYTLNAVEKVQEKYGDAELFYLTSSEYLDPDHKWWMGKWSGGKELFKLVTILVFPRDKHEMGKLEEWAKLIPEARIECIEVASPELSSTMIRESVAKGRSIWYPPALGHPDDGRQARALQRRWCPGSSQTSEHAQGQTCRHLWRSIRPHSLRASAPG
jgi:nicotinate-nucleotide adenylyltransferase